MGSRKTREFESNMTEVERKCNKSSQKIKKKTFKAQKQNRSDLEGIIT